MQYPLNEKIGEPELL